MARCSLKSHEAQVTQVVKKPFDSSLGLKLTQLPRAKEETSGRWCTLKSNLSKSLDVGIANWELTHVPWC